MVSFTVPVFALLLVLFVSDTPILRHDSPVVRLPIAKKIKERGPVQLLQHDQARARGLVAQAARSSGKHVSPQLPRIAGLGSGAMNTAFEYTVFVSASVNLCLAIATTISAGQIEVGQPPQDCERYDS